MGAHHQGVRRPRRLSTLPLIFSMQAALSGLPPQLPRSRALA